MCEISFTFTFMHLADAFIQSDLQCIQAIHFFFYQHVCSLGIEPTTFALLTQCSTTEHRNTYTLIEYQCHCTQRRNRQRAVCPVITSPCWVCVCCVRACVCATHGGLSDTRALEIRSRGGSGFNSLLVRSPDFEKHWAIPLSAC